MHKRIYSLLSVGTVLSGTLYVVACGGGSKTPDAGVKLKADAAVDAKPCSAMASYNPGSTWTYQGAEDDGSGSGYTEYLQWQGGLSSTPDVFLDVIALSGDGTGSGCTAEWPSGNVTAKNGIDLSMACDALVIVGANIVNNQAMDLYPALSGTLNVTAAGVTGGTFTGTLSNVMLQHYDYVAGTGFTMADPDNCMTEITSASFTASITMGSAAVPGERWGSLLGRQLPNR